MIQSAVTAGCNYLFGANAPTCCLQTLLATAPCRAQSKLNSIISADSIDFSQRMLVRKAPVCLCFLWPVSSLILELSFSDRRFKTIAAYSEWRRSFIRFSTSSPGRKYNCSLAGKGVEGGRSLKLHSMQAH